MSIIRGICTKDTESVYLSPLLITWIPVAPATMDLMELQAGESSNKRRTTWEEKRI